MADDVGVELLALDENGRQRRGADRAAEIAQHVRQARRRARFARRDAGRGDRADRRDDQRLADRAHDIGQQELIARRVERKRRIHEAARREQRDADESDVAHVEPLHQHRHERDQQQLRQAGPGENRADLLGVVALHLAEILRQDIDGAEQREADQDIGDDADAEIAARRAAAG